MNDYFFIEGLFSIWYVQHGPELNHRIHLPRILNIHSFENFLIYFLLIILIIPLLKKQKDQSYEKHRRKVLKIAVIIGGLILSVKLYGLISI